MKKYYEGKKDTGESKNLESQINKMKKVAKSVPKPKDIPKSNDKFIPKSFKVS